MTEQFFLISSFEDVKAKVRVVEEIKHHIKKMNLVFENKSEAESCLGDHICCMKKW